MQSLPGETIPALEPPEKHIPERHYEILVFGIEKKGLTAPKEPVKTKNFALQFAPMGTPLRFNEFDVVVLFQGIFESYEWKSNYVSSHLVHNYDRDELDRRKNEAKLLLEKKGLLCFLLCTSFRDREDGRTFTDMDLAKWHLNYRDLYRKDFSARVSPIQIQDDDFRPFLEVYGAASSYFEDVRNNFDCRVIARAVGRMAGMIHRGSEYFLPVLVPDNRPTSLGEYFTLVADALIASTSKRHQYLPLWVNHLKFVEEAGLEAHRLRALAEIETINTRIGELTTFKGVLALSGSNLVDSVATVFRLGLGFAVDPTDDHKEDLKILGADRKPILLCEVKGTNAGVKREHGNQADSHRERSGFGDEFPTLLVVNTNIKNSRSVSDKDQEVAREQVLHAKRNGVLILRTLDLLYLVRMSLAGSLDKAKVTELLTTNTGWLRVSERDWTVVNGEQPESEK